MRSILRSSALAFFAVSSLSLAACDETKQNAADAAVSKPATASTAAAAAIPGEKCEHGVEKAICSRCNPGLAVAFKAKNDWCEEHARAESQCVLCHPELAQKGIK